MLTISVRYLMGRAVATHPSEYGEAEWPPHPDRLFMALVAAWGGTGRDDVEAAALRWLEAQPPPGLSASGEKDITRRDVVTVFVPVNDNTVPKVKDEPSDEQIAEGMALLPGQRGKQARFFPAVRPKDDIVSFHWPVNPDREQATVLAGLCGKVTRLGHSSSLVQCWMEISDDSAPPAHRTVWEPDPAAMSGERLRVPHEGRFDELERLFQANLRPTASR